MPKYIVQPHLGLATPTVSIGMEWHQLEPPGSFDRHFRWRYSKDKDKNVCNESNLKIKIENSYCDSPTSFELQVFIVIASQTTHQNGQDTEIQQIVDRWIFVGAQYFSDILHGNELLFWILFDAGQMNLQRFQ